MEISHLPNLIKALTIQDILLLLPKISLLTSKVQLRTPGIGAPLKIVQYDEVGGDVSHICSLLQ